jgi:hypothetical protein
MAEPASVAAPVLPLREGRDYTLDRQGRWVFTARYLKARGTCCFQACRNCPWGQAGRSAAEASADLQSRLDRLAQRLHGAGVEVTGYRLGVLHARPARADRGVGRRAELAELGRRVQAQAEDLLTVTGVQWAGADLD